MINATDLLDDLNKKLEETWDDYDNVEHTRQGVYFLGKIRGLEYAIALLETTND